MVNALLADLELLGPDAVAISGDLTQRARTSEFVAARSFIAHLPAPAVAVAGNHDVPLLPLHKRFIEPYGRYQRELSPELQPQLATDRLVALGLNTARGNTRKSGRLNRSQIGVLERTYSAAPPGALRVLVTHHPFVPPPGRPEASIVGRASLALRAINGAGVDLLLSGHRHIGHVRVLPVGPAAASASALVVLAGTACSKRNRDEGNSFNVVEGDRGEVKVTVRQWNGVEFSPVSSRLYLRRGRGWIEKQPGDESVSKPFA